MNRTMAARHMTVRVVGSDGRAKSGKRIGIMGPSGSGVSKSGRTGADGTADFSIDYDGWVDIYVDGALKIKSTRVCAEIKIVI